MSLIRSAVEVYVESDPVPDNNAKENFDTDIESWLYAIKRSKAKFDAQTCHELIREMSGSLLEAVTGLVVFDLVELAKKLHKATDEAVCLKEIVFYLLANLPNPSKLSPQEFKTFEEIVFGARAAYPEVVARFDSRIKALKK
jgi:hypothetical protein